MITIAVDAMGGDNAPYEIINGALQAVNTSNIKIILVGKQDIIKNELEALSPKGYKNIEIKHAEDIIDMAESPALAFRKKKQSSIHVGLRLVKTGEAQAFISAGNTGAVMASATFILGKIKNVDRPAIATVLPSGTGGIIALDMGSNVDCKAHNLQQFAVMGHYYSKFVLDVKNPRVALLNIGEEEDKGNDLTANTYPLLQKLPINFIGNIEGKDILFNKADVVVCDGFVGNTLLKFGEGAVELFMKFFKKEFKSSILSFIGLLFLIPALKRFKKRFDYEEFGGAPLLGVNGITIISHGKSKAKAIKNGIKVATHAVENRIIEKLVGEFQK